MSLVVRAIVRAQDADHASADEVIQIRAGALAVLVTRVEEPVTATEEELRSHDALTRRIHDRVPALPARFGQVFASEAEVVAAVEPRAAALRDAIEAVDGRVEIAITLRWRTPEQASAIDEPSSGREYLALRAAVLRVRERAEALAARLVGEVASDRAHARVKTCPRPGVAAIVAILVERDGVPTARDRVLSFGERSSEVSATIDGVFAPYSFVS